MKKNLKLKKFFSIKNLITKYNAKNLKYAKVLNITSGTNTALALRQEGHLAINSSSITAYTAVSGDVLLIDTQNNPVTITLPASPSAGDKVSIMDASAAGGFGSNNVTVNRNSQPIRGAASNLTLSTNNQSIKLYYTNATKGWQYVYNQTT